MRCRDPTSRRYTRAAPATAARPYSLPTADALAGSPSISRRALTGLVCLEPPGGPIRTGDAGADGPEDRDGNRPAPRPGAGECDGGSHRGNGGRSGGGSRIRLAAPGWSERSVASATAARVEG